MSQTAQNFIRTSGNVSTVSLHTPDFFLNAISIKDDMSSASPLQASMLSELFRLPVHQWLYHIGEHQLVNMFLRNGLSILADVLVLKHEDWRLLPIPCALRAQLIIESQKLLSEAEWDSFFSSAIPVSAPRNAVLDKPTSPLNHDFDYLMTPQPIYRNRSQNEADYRSKTHPTQPQLQSFHYSTKSYPPSNRFSPPSSQPIIFQELNDASKESVYGKPARFRSPLLVHMLSAPVNEEGTSGGSEYDAIPRSLLPKHMQIE